MILGFFSVAMNNNWTDRHKDIHLKLVLLQLHCILGFLISDWYLWRKKNPLFFIFIFYFYFYFLFLCLCIRHRQDNFETESRAHKTSDCSFFHFFFNFFFFGFLEWTESDKFSWSADTKVQRCQMKGKQKTKTFFCFLLIYFFICFWN
jgi:hypothetical protein